MKESEARRAERDAREHIAARGKIVVHQHGTLARYLVASSYRETGPPGEPGATLVPGAVTGQAAVTGPATAGRAGTARGRR
jgi:hypothetical protein